MGRSSLCAHLERQVRFCSYASIPYELLESLRNTQLLRAAQHSVPVLEKTVHVTATGLLRLISVNKRV